MYESNAERQAAYRQRKAESRAALVDSVVGAVVQEYVCLLLDMDPHYPGWAELVRERREDWICRLVWSRRPDLLSVSKWELVSSIRRLIPTGG
jgi:hypothetical protein